MAIMKGIGILALMLTLFSPVRDICSMAGEIKFEKGFEVISA